MQKYKASIRMFTSLCIIWICGVGDNIKLIMFICMCLKSCLNIDFGGKHHVECIRATMNICEWFNACQCCIVSMWGWKKSKRALCVFWKASEYQLHSTVYLHYILFDCIIFILITFNDIIFMLMIFNIMDDHFCPFCPFLR